MTDRTLKLIAVIILVVLSGLVFFHKLNAAQVELWDENTNINVVDDTLGSDNTLILSKEGDAFFEKPPLWYYSTQLLVSVVGTNLFIYRLISAVSGLVITLAIFYLLNKRHRLYASFIGALSFLAIGQNVITNASGYFSSHTYRSADLDPLQIALIVLSLVSVSNLGKSRTYLYITYALLALAFMAKGPFALLPTILITVYIFRKRKELEINQTDYLKAGTLFISIIVPWHLFMVQNFGKEFIDSYLGYHIIERSTSTLEEHNKWRLFYFEVFSNLKVNILWPFSVIGTIMLLIKKNKDMLYIFPLLLIVSLLITLTVIDTKLAWYLLPIYPFQSILIGVFLSKIDGWNKYISLIVYLGIVIPIAIGIILNISYIRSL